MKQTFKNLLRIATAAMVTVAFVAPNAAYAAPAKKKSTKKSTTAAVTWKTLQNKLEKGDFVQDNYTPQSVAELINWSKSVYPTALRLARKQAPSKSGIQALKSYQKTFDAKLGDAYSNTTMEMAYGASVSSCYSYFFELYTMGCIYDRLTDASQHDEALKFFAATLSLQKAMGDFTVDYEIASVGGGSFVMVSGAYIVSNIALQAQEMLSGINSALAADATDVTCSNYPSNFVDRLENGNYSFSNLDPEFFEYANFSRQKYDDDLKTVRSAFDRFSTTLQSFGSSINLKGNCMNQAATMLGKWLTMTPGE